MRELTTGDDFVRMSALTDADSGDAWNVSTATEISATVISSDYKTQYCATVTLDSNDPGSSWSNGIVVISIPAATTAEIASHVTGKTTGIVSVQVEIDGEKTTVRDSVYLIEGHIE